MALIVCLCVVATSMIVKRRSAKVIANEHELAKMKQDAEHQRAMFVVATDREYKFKQVDKNLITSHRDER